MSDIRYINLTQGKAAIVDADDYEWLSQWKWYAGFDKSAGTWYALRTVVENGKKRTVRMHRLILNSKDGEEVDHADLDGLNNSRINLRKATHAQNMFNKPRRRGSSSGFKGVSWEKHVGKWRARIMANGKKYELGLFPTPEAAALSYASAALVVHREFARV